MENNDKRNKTVTLTVIGIIVLLIVLVGATYAYFSARSKADTQTINTANVDLEVKIDEEATHIENIKPTTWVSTDDAKTNMDIVQIPIKVTNKSTIDINYDLFITPSGLALNNNLDGDEQELQGGDLSDVKYVLYETTDGTDIDNPINQGDFTNENTKLKIVGNKAIKALTEGSTNNIHNYMLYIYIENKDEEQNQLQGITFDIKIEGVTPAEKIAQTILANETLKESQPNFTENSTDKGLYVLNDINAVAASTKSTKNEGKIYYYRGAVENNYVSFGNYTKDVTNKLPDYSEAQVTEAGDPILWRIVRINEDRSVTLIAEHNIGLLVEFNSTTDSNYNGSNIKTIVDTWYDETFKNPSDEYEKNKQLDNLVLETEFCHDRLFVTSYSSALLTRLNRTPPQPTLKCGEQYQINAKAGLITADEMIYAGYLYNKVMTANSTYLDNNTFGFWTMSPGDDKNILIWLNYSSGNQMSPSQVNQKIACARPVITLSSEAVVTKGDGTLENPYLIG